MANVVAGLLHELNNPVGAIVGATDVLQRGVRKLGGMDGDVRQAGGDAYSERRRKTIEVIGDSALTLMSATERVKEALDALKRFSHLDQTEIASYDVNDALSDCQTLLAQQTRERITVKKDLRDIPKIRCRPSEINQLLMSVLKNAVEAIPGTGSIELRTSLRDGFVRVDVTDTGVGIPEAKLRDLFAPKFGGETGRMKLGLGLITSQSIVQRHGGEIAVDSVEGRGTRVSVKLVVKSADGPGA
ncbi:MAG: HAMP domain-containing sensor histidine kinase [Candidatus Latescibacterota bacterium]|jgi:two-component system NtrC family sensor kinase